MDYFDYTQYVNSRRIMSQPLTNGHEENYIVATADDSVISNYSMRFQKRGYVVNVIDLTNPAKSTVAFDALHQINSKFDAKYLTEQLDAPWLQDDMYWRSMAAALVECLICSLKHADHDAYISELMEIMNELYLGVVRDGKIPPHIEGLIDAIIAADPQGELVHDWEKLSTLPTKTVKEVCKQACSILRYYFRYVDSTMPNTLPAFDPRSLLKNGSVLFVRVDPIVNERTNYACIIFKQISKALYDYLQNLEDPVLPIKTNFVCGPNIFQPLCQEILGDSIAPQLGLHLVFALPDAEFGDVPRVLDRALQK